MRKSDPTILLIEDDKNDQELLVRSFRKIGMSQPIRTVGNGLEAIQYMMGEGQYSDRVAFPYPTFIITDLKMPGADGFAVLEFLKSNPEWAVIPTVVLSASIDLDDIKKAYMLGASSYHVKPKNSDALLHQVLVLHAYWMTCEVPEVDASGKQLRTASKGKLGERFSQPSNNISAPKRVEVDDGEAD